MTKVARLGPLQLRIALGQLKDDNSRAVLFGQQGLMEKMLSLLNSNDWLPSERRRLLETFGQEAFDNGLLSQAVLWFAEKPDAQFSEKSDLPALLSACSEKGKMKLRFDFMNIRNPFSH